MSKANIKKRIVSMALYVSSFVVFAFVSGVRNAECSCGDYLKHARSSEKAIFSDLRDDSIPEPVCRSGNCRSTPSIPLSEHNRVVLVRKQPADFDPILKSLNSPVVRILEFIDEDLPLSVTLEVPAPPPRPTV